MPNDLIPIKLWKERTEVRMSRRSKELQALDRELERYEKFGGGQARWAVGQALEAWKKSKGPGDEWKKSSRNKNNAFDDLTKLLEGFHHTAEEREAIELVREHQKVFIRTLFGGRKLSLSAKALTAYQTGKAAYTVDKLVADARGERSGASMAGSAAWELVREALGDVWDTPELAEVVLEVLGESLSDLVSAITPAVGLVKSAGMTLFYGVKTAAKGKQVWSISEADEGFAPGAPEEAFLAVRALLKRELAKSAARTATYAAETGAKTAGLLADGGTATTAAVGVAATLARLMITLNALRVDVLEMRRANKALRDPDSITFSIFSKNPLLGCYFLACSDTSTIVNFMFEDVGRPGFQYLVEKAVKKHLEPTLDIATHLILDHRLMLSGGDLAKISVIASGRGARTRMALRNPGSIDHLKAKMSSKVRGREVGFYK